MALTQNPYQAKIDKIKNRLADKPKKKTNYLKAKLTALKGQKQIHQKKNAPVYKAPDPFLDPGYLMDTAAADRAKAFGQTGIGLSESQIESQYGLSNERLGAARGQLGESEGIVKSRYGFDDTSNPLSLARQLETAYANQQKRTTNTYAARGQQYSGAVGRARSGDAYRRDLSEQELRQAYEDRLRSLAAARQNLAYEGQDLSLSRQNALDSLAQQGFGIDLEYQNQMSEAEWDAVNRALKQGVDPSEIPALGKAGKAVKKTGATGTKAITKSIATTEKKQTLKAKLATAKANDNTQKVKAIKKKLKKL